MPQMLEESQQPRPLEYQSGIRIPKAEVVRSIPDAPVTRIEKWLAIVSIAAGVLCLSAVALAIFLSP
jgi:hypothetical protein